MNTKNTPFLISIAISLASCTDQENEDLLSRRDYYGVFDASETCPQYNTTHEITIGQGSGGDDQVVIHNYNERWDVAATVNGSNITINTAVYELNQGVFIELSGSGTFDGQVLTMSDSKNCNMTATKR